MVWWLQLIANLKGWELPRRLGPVCRRLTRSDGPLGVSRRAHLDWIKWGESPTLTRGDLVLESESWTEWKGELSTYIHCSAPWQWIQYDQPPQVPATRTHVSLELWAQTSFPSLKLRLSGHFRTAAGMGTKTHRAATSTRTFTYCNWNSIRQAVNPSCLSPSCAPGTHCSVFCPWFFLLLCVLYVES